MVVLALGVGTGCRKAGLDDSSPTAPGGPLAPGSLIAYDVIGASDANGVGSSIVCLPLAERPDGMGYAPVAARQLRGLGFGVSVACLRRHVGRGERPSRAGDCRGRRDV